MRGLILWQEFGNVAPRRLYNTKDNRSELVDWFNEIVEEPNTRWVHLINAETGEILESYT